MRNGAEDLGVEGEGTCMSILTPRALTQIGSVPPALASWRPLRPMTRPQEGRKTGGWSWSSNSSKVRNQLLNLLEEGPECQWRK